MFKEDVLSGSSWLPLISRIVWAKNPRNPRHVAPLSRSRKDLIVPHSGLTANGHQNEEFEN